jgi:RimJ/RimL family protein N-acetyltransferase
LERLTAGHFVDNPASGHVLEKVGFMPTGQFLPRYSAGRGEAATSKLYEMDLAAERSNMNAPASLQKAYCMAA